MTVKRSYEYVRLARVRAGGLKVAVVGHMEWVQFARVSHVPSAGEVVHARDPFEEPAGGGAVAAVQLARLAGAAAFVTELGDDEYGRRSVVRLSELGVDVRAAVAQAPSRRAVTLVDAAGERTITTFGPRLEPRGGELQQRWNGLEGLDALYFTAGDEAELRIARLRSRVLVASPRARDALGHGVALDALVLSGGDAIELQAAAPVLDEAQLVVWTEGERGGHYRCRDGVTGRWQAAQPPGERADAYGCGDSFAAGLTYGLGAGLELADALALAARCGAVCATGHGPYERQLSWRDVQQLERTALSIDRVPTVYHGILKDMAKVMVSMPDDLLSEVDAEANRLGTSRSAVLRDFADAALRRRRTDRAAAMDKLLLQSGRHGGAAAERVKATRP